MEYCTLSYFKSFMDDIDKRQQNDWKDLFPGDNIQETKSNPSFCFHIVNLSLFLDLPNLQTIQG